MKSKLGKAMESAIKEPASQTHPGGSSEDARCFENKVRRNIFSLITLHPCLGISDISEKLEVSSPTVKWHLEKLLQSGWLVERHEGRKRLFWAEGQISEDDYHIFSLLAARNSKPLLMNIIRSPGQIQSQHASDLGLKHQGVASTAAKLADLGLISVMTEGVHTRYYPTRKLLEMSEENYERSRAFRKFMLEKMKQEGSAPKIVKSKKERLIVELGQKTARYVVEVGLDPFATALGI